MDITEIIYKEGKKESSKYELNYIDETIEKHRTKIKELELSIKEMEDFKKELIGDIK